MKLTSFVFVKFNLNCLFVFCSVHCVQNNNVPSQINYARLQTNTETNGSANNEQHNGQQSSYDECPSMTLESVDKYQLLNFVLSPLRSNEQRMETNGTAAS